jgi:hypothetical protein
VGEEEERRQVECERLTQSSLHGDGVGDSGGFGLGNVLGTVNFTIVTQSSLQGQVDTTSLFTACREKAGSEKRARGEKRERSKANRERSKRRGERRRNKNTFEARLVPRLGDSLHEFLLVDDFTATTTLFRSR